jgi:hypothetical protein
MTSATVKRLAKTGWNLVGSYVEERCELTRTADKT